MSPESLHSEEDHTIHSASANQAYSSPRPRTHSALHLAAAHTTHQRRSFAQKCRISSSFCLLLLIFTTSLVFVQLLLFRSDAFSPVVCQPQETTGKLQKALFSEGGRLRFPRTKRRLPRSIIIGARKCGTRALLEFLNLHPAVQKAAEEVHFFDDDSKYALGLDWYRRRMPYSFPGQVTVEKSPAYFVTPRAPQRIRRMDPSVRLLLIVREPVVRLVSDYAQLAANRARRDRPLASFEEMVLRQDGTVDTGYRAVRTGMYAVYFRRWLAAFPRRQIHVVDGDHLIADPFAEVRKIEDFLGIGRRVRPENFYYNDTKGFFCVRNETADKCLNDSKGRRHPRVSQEVVGVLRRFYEPHNRRFFEMAGVTFDWPSH